MTELPILVHPLACRCCGPSYVHAATAEDMARHLAQIEAMERLCGIRPLERMPERE